MTSPTKRPPGRPKLDNPRSEVVRYRVTSDELRALQAAADKAGQTLTDYARDRALAAARRAR
jgi:uncharacterized protein (DUF1778 family)